jgi:hypothetical protein
MTSISGWSIYMDTLVTGQSMVWGVSRLHRDRAAAICENRVGRLFTRILDPDTLAVELLVRDVHKIEEHTGSVAALEYVLLKGWGLF